ncbi:NACHT domain-containing protein [Streptomyces sp. NPDC008240]|uniref:NACHT domain-containing protein n=1 Tax=Streptomyces sp. NPDC008240 TaxID=3364822 RepID=UPI0036DFD999
MLSGVVAAGSSTPIINTPVVTAAGAVIAALIAAGVALWQARRNRKLEREKIELQEAASRRLKEHEQELKRRAEEYERERAARQAESDAAREAAKATALVEARRSNLAADAASYCSRLAQELSTLRILDMSRPMQLGRLYVQVRVQEQEPPRFLREEELDQDRMPDGAGRESPAPDTAASQTYAPVDALQRYQRIVVVGDPGAGKTTMLRHLALCMAEQTEGQGLPGLPAYVELFRFIQSEHVSLLDYLAEHWATQYGFADARAFLEEELVAGDVALLLDGLDEVLGGESAQDAMGAYHRVTEEVDRLATRFPRALIATTCRRHGWRGGLPQFQVLEALDFEWPQIEAFITNWFGDSDHRSGALVRALSANARLQTLATNPLLLSLIAIVYERDLELPERRAALYRRCIEVLLREWDAHRKITRYSRFTTDRKQDLLKQIARHYHQRGQRYFPEDDLLDLIAEFLPTIDLPCTDNRAILDEIAAQYGLLKVQAHGWYGFLHLTLQEHFAAIALLEEGAKGIERVVAARYDPWWEEVILLLAGSLPDASPLLLGVLQLEPGPRPTHASSSGRGEILNLPGDDLFHTDLLLAARCLIGSPRVADVELRRQILRTVWELLETSPYAEERRRAAEAIVGVLGSDRQMTDVVSYIGDGTKSEEARTALVDALALHGGPGVGKRLLGLITLLPDGQRQVSERVIAALGTLRVGAAVPKLLSELADATAAVHADRAIPEITSRLAAIVRALGAAGGPARAILDTIKEIISDDQSGPVILAARDALEDIGDPGVLEELLGLLVLDNGWFFERVNLAAAYLSLAGDQGVGTLLDLVRSDGTADSHRVPLMAGVADFTSTGRGRNHRAALLDLADDESMIWQVRWLALESLDHIPGTEDELAALRDSSNAYVNTAVAATSAAWGVPVRLDAIRSAILDGSVEPDLQYTIMVGRAHKRSFAWRGRVARRLAAALSPYGTVGVEQCLAERLTANEAVPYATLAWLQEFSLEAWADGYLSVHNRGERLDQAAIPLTIPQSRIHAILRCIATDLHDRHLDMETKQVLRAVAAAADDAESVAMLLKMIHRGDEFAEDAYSAAHLVSHRARVRVHPNHTIEPLP